MILSTVVMMMMIVMMMMTDGNALPHSTAHEDTPVWATTEKSKTSATSSRAAFRDSN